MISKVGVASWEIRGISHTDAKMNQVSRRVKQVSLDQEWLSKQLNLFIG